MPEVKENLVKTLETYQIIAESLLSHDFAAITHVPGFGGTQVFNHLKSLNAKNASICLNEEAAFSIAVGASVFGGRSACLVKTHGLAKMANAICSTLSIQQNAANLVFAFDDTTGKSSDNIFGARSLIANLEAPYFILGENPEQTIIEAIELSETKRIPVLIYIDCEILHEKSSFIGLTAKTHPLKFSKDPIQYVACPPLSKLQRERFLAKTDPGIHVSSPPEMLYKIPESLPSHLQAIYGTYEFFFHGLSALSPDFIAGDAGTSTLYAFDPRKLIDACTYMGGSPGMALGAHLAGAKSAWSITGDFSFLAAGILGWNEIIARDSPIKLVVLVNGIAGATGGQAVPPAVLESFFEGNQKRTHVVSGKTTEEELRRIIGMVNESNSPQIIKVCI